MRKQSGNARSTDQLIEIQHVLGSKMVILFRFGCVLIGTFLLLTCCHVARGAIPSCVDFPNGHDDRRTHTTNHNGQRHGDCHHHMGVLVCLQTTGS
eukprot:6489846-Amphidinium_carterae.1